MACRLALSDLLLVAACLGAGVQQGQGGTSCNADFYRSSASKFVGVCSGEEHTCAWTSGGSAFCWGQGKSGRTGYGDQNDRGKNGNSMGSNLPKVDIWGASSNVGVVMLSCGKDHTCAALADGTVKCWGGNDNGQLGYGDDEDRGDSPSANEMGNDLSAIDLTQGSAKVLSASLGSKFTCVLLSDGTVYCWGEGSSGQLGLGNSNDIGDDNSPAMEDLAALDLGSDVNVIQICAGEGHACVLVSDGFVKCWGANDKGQLGLGDKDNRGDDDEEMGNYLPYVNLGEGMTATSIACGKKHVCAALASGIVKCWGQNNEGQLGTGDTINRGEKSSEMGDSLPSVDLDSSLQSVTAVTAGEDWSCAVFGITVTSGLIVSVPSGSTNGLICWGDGSKGALGQEDDSDIKSDIARTPAIDLGSDFDVTYVDGTVEHLCAVSEQGTIKCWGNGDEGRLGYEDTQDRGREPESMGDDLPTVNVGATLEECLACPDHASAPSGSTDKTDCECNEGYSGTAGGPCTKPVASASSTTSIAVPTTSFSMTSTTTPTATAAPTTSSSTTTIVPLTSSSSTTTSLAPTTSSSTAISSPAPTTSSSSTTTAARTTSSSSTTTTALPTTSSSTTTTVAPTSSSYSTTTTATATAAPTTSSSTTTIVPPTTSSSTTTSLPPTTSSSTATSSPAPTTSSSSTTTAAPTTSSSSTTTNVAPTTSSSTTTSSPAPTTSSSTTTTAVPTTSSSSSTSGSIATTISFIAPTTELTTPSTTTTVPPTISSSTTLILAPTTAALTPTGKTPSSTTTTALPTVPITTSSTTTTAALTTLGPSTCCACDKGSCPRGNCEAPGSSSRSECNAVDCIVLCALIATTAATLELSTITTTVTSAPTATSSTTITTAPTTSFSSSTTQAPTSSTITPAPTTFSPKTVITTPAPITTPSTTAAVAPTTSSTTATSASTTSSTITTSAAPTTTLSMTTPAPATSASSSPTTTPSPTTTSSTTTPASPTTSSSSTTMVDPTTSSTSTTTLEPTTSSSSTTAALTSSSSSSTPEPTSSSSSTTPASTTSSTSTTAEPTTSSSATSSEPMQSLSSANMPSQTTPSSTDTSEPTVTASSTTATATSSLPTWISTTPMPSPPLIGNTNLIITITINLPNISPSDITAEMERALVTIFAQLLSLPSTRIVITTLPRRRLLAARVTVRVAATSAAEASRLSAVLSGMDLTLPAHIALHSDWKTITVSDIEIAFEAVETTTTKQQSTAPQTPSPSTATPSTTHAAQEHQEYPVVEAVPSKCTIGGGTVVTIMLGASPPVFSLPPVVVFAVDGEVVTSSVVSPMMLVAKCPQAELSEGFGEVVDAGGGGVLARFDFVYNFPAPSLSPNRVLASGGNVSIFIFQSPPPAISTDCKVTFGGVFGNIVSSSSANSQLVVKTIAPPSLTVGRVAVVLTCFAIDSLALTYLAMPKATAVVTTPSSGKCLTLGECTAAVAMTDASSTAIEASQFSLSCTGVSFGVFPGSTSREPRLSVLQATPALLSATISFPPPQTAGTITCHLAPLAAPAGIDPAADMSASFTIQVFLSPVIITSVFPPSVPFNAGAEVEVLISGVGVLADTTSLDIMIGDITVTGWALLYSDVEGSGIMLAAPQTLGIGNAEIRILVINTGAEASSSLVLVPTDQNAECVSRCRVGASGSIDGAWATVAVGGFPADTSAANLNIEVAGTRGEVIGFAGNDKWLVNLPAVEFGSDVGGGEAVRRWLRLQTPAGGGAEAMVEVVYVPAPRADSARFSSDGSTIEVRFDKETSMEGTGSCEAVADVFGNVMGLGSDSVCSWTEASVLSIVLGIGATVLPGEVLALTAPGITSLDGASDTMPAAQVELERPRLFLVPELSIAGPSQVAGCDAVSVFTSGASARAMHFQWGCHTNLAVARILSQTNASFSSFRGNLLVLDEPTEIWVQATTFLGAKSRVLSLTVTRVAVPPPLVSIEVPPPPYLRSTALFFSASCKFSQCAQTETQLRFAWILSPGSEVNPASILLSGDKVWFEIPADTLDAGTHYTITLQTSQGMQRPVTSTVSLDILSSPLVAVVDGGNRLVSRDTAVVLDASASHDPDRLGGAACSSRQPASAVQSECLQALSFSWRCVAVSAAGKKACRLEGMEVLQLSATSTPVLDMAALALNNVDSIVVTVTVTGSRGRFASASLAFRLAAGDVIDVGVTKGEESAGRVVYMANVDSKTEASMETGNLNVSYNWRIAGPGLKENGHSGLALSPWNTRQLVLDVGSTLATQLFQAGAKYTVQLVVRSGGMEGASEVDLRRPLPPYGGSCWMKIAVTEELVGALLARCENWNADSLPLSYRYGAANAPWDDATAQWSVPSYLSQAELRLGEGTYVLSVEVSDGVGTSTISQGMRAVVTSSRNISDGQREETLSGVLTELDQLGSVSQLMQLSQSIMKGAKLEQTGSVSRRLLASSAAYRLRVRRMLLNQMEGGVAQSLTARSAPAALLTTKELSSADSPDELQPGMSASAAVVFEHASQQIGIGDISLLILTDAMLVCNAILFASQMEDTETSRDQVIGSTLTSMQLIGGLFAKKMYTAERAHKIVLDNVALEVMKVATSNKTLAPANLDLNTKTGALVSMSLKSPVQLDVEQSSGIAVLQIKLLHNVWNHYQIEVISYGVSGVILMDENEGKDDALDRRCLTSGKGNCMRLTVEVDLVGRTIPELELFKLGLGLQCFRWDHAAWNPRTCQAKPLFPTGNNWTKTQLESSVQCDCDKPDGLFVVGFSTNYFLPMESPWVTTKYYRILHAGYLRDSILMGLCVALTITILAMCIPLLYMHRWFKHFGHEEGRPNLYVHADLSEAEQHILHTVRTRKVPLLCSFKATASSYLITPDRTEDDDQPPATRPSTALTATVVDVRLGSRTDSTGNLLTERLASLGSQLFRVGSATSKSNGRGNTGVNSSKTSGKNVMQAWGSSLSNRVSSKKAAMELGKKTLRQESILRTVSNRTVGVDRVEEQLDLYGALHRKLVNEDGVFYSETLGVNHLQMLEPFAWSYAHWFAEFPIAADPSESELDRSSSSTRTLTSNDNADVIQPLGPMGFPRNHGRRRSSGISASISTDVSRLWSAKAPLPPLSIGRLASFRSINQDDRLPVASAPESQDVPSGVPEEPGLPLPWAVRFQRSNPYSSSFELDAFRAGTNTEREREPGAGVMPGLLTSQGSILKMPAEEGGCMGLFGWEESSVPRNPPTELAAAERDLSLKPPADASASASLVNSLASPISWPRAGNRQELSRFESAPLPDSEIQQAESLNFSAPIPSPMSVGHLDKTMNGLPLAAGDPLQVKPHDLHRNDSTRSITRLESHTDMGRQPSVRLGSGEWMQQRHSLDSPAQPHTSTSLALPNIALESIKNFEQFDSLPFGRVSSAQSIKNLEQFDSFSFERASSAQLGGGAWMQRKTSLEDLTAAGTTHPYSEVESDLCLHNGNSFQQPTESPRPPRHAPGRRGSGLESTLEAHFEELEHHGGDDQTTPRKHEVDGEKESSEREAGTPTNASTHYSLCSSPAAQKVLSPRSVPSLRLDGMKPTL